MKSTKNDAADAEAICEAVARANMRFVAVKTIAQLEDADNGLTAFAREFVANLYEELQARGGAVDAYDAKIGRLFKANPVCQRLAKVEGVGPITATALVAAGDAKTFKNGRQRAAWLGLVPRQYSSGGKQTLLGISSPHAPDPRGAGRGGGGPTQAGCPQPLDHGARCPAWREHRCGGSPTRTRGSSGRSWPTETSTGRRCENTHERIPLIELEAVPPTIA